MTRNKRKKRKDEWIPLLAIGEKITKGKTGTYRKPFTNKNRALTYKAQIFLIIFFLIFIIMVIQFLIIASIKSSCLGLLLIKAKRFFFKE